MGLNFLRKYERGWRLEFFALVGEFLLLLARLEAYLCDKRNIQINLVPLRPSGTNLMEMCLNSVPMSNR